MAKNCGLYNWLLGIGVEARLLLSMAGLGVDSLPLPKRLRAGHIRPVWVACCDGRYATNREKITTPGAPILFLLAGW